MQTAQQNIDNDDLLKLLEYINKHTAANPAQSSALMNVFAIDERKLRKMISVARKKYHASIAASSTGGYYRANNWEQYKSTFKQRIRQAMAEIKTQNAVRKSLMSDMQPTIFDQINYKTEYDALIEFVEELFEEENESTINQPITN